MGEDQLLRVDWDCNCLPCLRSDTFTMTLSTSTHIDNTTYRISECVTSWQCCRRPWRKFVRAHTCICITDSIQVSNRCTSYQWRYMHMYIHTYILPNFIQISARSITCICGSSGLNSNVIPDVNNWENAFKVRGYFASFGNFCIWIQKHTKSYSRYRVYSRWINYSRRTSLSRDSETLVDDKRYPKCLIHERRVLNMHAQYVHNEHHNIAVSNVQ